MTPGEALALWVAGVGALMWILGRWEGRAALVRAAWRVQDDLDAQAADDDPGPAIVPPDLGLAASIPGAVPSLAYIPDPARVQLVGGFYIEGDFEDQYRATWAHAAERTAWAGHIIDRIWEGINREQDSAATA